MSILHNLYQLLSVVCCSMQCASLRHEKKMCKIYDMYEKLGLEFSEQFWSFELVCQVKMYRIRV